MVYTNFPQGVTSLGVPVIGSGQLPITQGNYWFVSSTTGSTGNPGNEADLPFATLAGAVAAAASGDVIVLLPNHAETIIAAAGIAINVAGLTIVGMGEGATRPTFTFGTSTAATMTITAASVSISNIIGICNIDQLVSAFVISAADCTFGTAAGPVEWHDGAANKEALRAVLTTAAADRLNVNLIYIGFTAGTHGVNAIRLVGADTANIVIDYFGICTTAVVEFVTTASANVTVSGYFYVSGTTNFSKDVVDTVGGSTWFLSGYDGAAGAIVTGGSAAAVGPGFTPATAAVAEGATTGATAAMVNGNTLFTVAGGPIKIIALMSVCITANDATASTLQYQAVSTLGTLTQTISGASASLANVAIGVTVVMQGTALSTAPIVNANGAGLMPSNPIVVEAGTIKAVIGAGSTTGTWKHYIRYQPLVAGVTVVGT